MSKKIFAAIAILLLLSVLPYGAYGEATAPYIEIIQPRDGQTVGKTTELVVVAEGYGLRDPFVTIQGESGIGVGFPLEGCVYSTDPVPVPLNEGNTDSSILPPGPTKMYCKTEINLGSFEGERIRLSVSVHEINGILTDSVGLFVSGQCV